jgi:hypothetical protein|tara:strand:+ start:612 stop:806 length:195 start_codon:yes stop_codon:yes gene_type:complete
VQDIDAPLVEQETLHLSLYLKEMLEELLVAPLTGLWEAEAVTQLQALMVRPLVADVAELELRQL